jgi:hypothetical protein
LQPKALYFVQPRSENFGIAIKNTEFWCGEKTKFWIFKRDLESATSYPKKLKSTKHCVCVCGGSGACWSCGVGCGRVGRGGHTSKNASQISFEGSSNSNCVCVVRVNVMG